MYDLGIFYQAVKSYSEFKPGISVAKGLHNFGVANFSVLGDHWSPIDAVLAPLIWIHDDPRDLLVAQAVLFALAIPWIWAFTRTAAGGGRKGTIAAYCASLAYGMSWPIAGAVGFDFHEVAFAPLLTAITLERLQKGRWRTALIAMAGLLLVKEDMGFFVAGIGLGLIVTRQLRMPRQRLAGLVLVVVGIVYTVVAIYVLIPAMGGRANYYWAYQALGPNAPSALKHIVSDPMYAAGQLITPRVKLHTELELLAPFLFLSLLSPCTLPVIPLLLERMLGSKFPAWWIDGVQYNAYLIVPIVLGAVDGAVKLDKWAARGWRAATGPGTRGRGLADRAAGIIGPACAVAFLLIAIALVPAFGFKQLFTSSFYHRDATATAEQAAASVVPSGVTVEVCSNIGPFLLNRDTVEIWDGYGDTPKFAPWIIASDSQGQFTWYTVKDQVARIAFLRAHGYVTVFQRDGFIVLHAPNVAYSGPVRTGNSA